jgi:hypothetical protein
MRWLEQDRGGEVGIEQGEGEGATEQGEVTVQGGMAMVQNEVARAGPRGCA